MKVLSSLALTLTIAFGAAADASALDEHKAAYAGGTLALPGGSQARVEGHLDLSDPQALVFVSDGSPALRIQYSSIHDLEFGQKVRRRVAAATGTTALLGPLGALAFTMKKREHFLTVVYTDDRGVNQVAILELGKDVVRSTLLTIEERSGTVVEYQDQDARNWRSVPGVRQ
jgi:hypothetical protein